MFVDTYMFRNYEGPVAPLNEGQIMGLSYIAYNEGTWQGEPMTSYLLEHSYYEALDILTRQLGQPSNNRVGIQNDQWPLFAHNPSGVIFQKLFDSYRLITRGSLGVGWDKD